MRSACLILVPLLILLTLQLGGCLATPIMRGELHGRLYWQGEILLQGNVILAEDTVLTIAPGTSILFLPIAADEDDLTDHPYFPGSELIVRGRLMAKGTATQPIEFRAFDSVAKPGSWGGINVEESVQAIFQFCTFRQADSAIHARRSWVSVTDSHFHDNLVGIRFHDSDILIENNLLENNDAAIRFHFGAPVIRLNKIHNNNKGIFITASPWGYRIRNNSFVNNRPYHVSLGEEVTDSVDLRHNYWGDDAAELVDFIYDGRVDDWLGVIDYRPILVEPPNDRASGWNH